MHSFLKNHPFAVEAFFRRSFVLTFAFPVETIRPLLPACVTADTYQDKWAFIAAAIVKTENLRPRNLRFLPGNDFTLIGYRVFVKYINNKGKRLRGLYILKSETDSRKMTLLGNIFTHYRYATTDVSISGSEERLTIHSNKSGLHVEAEINKKETGLPSGSLFTNWNEARRFAGPLPFTFTYNSQRKKVVIIEGVRENWTPAPVSVLSYQLNFLKELNIGEPVLASAFMIENIPYYWKKGKIESWNQKEENFRVY